MTLALFLDLFSTVETQQFSVPAIDIAQQRHLLGHYFLFFSPKLASVVLYYNKSKNINISQFV